MYGFKPLYDIVHALPYPCCSQIAAISDGGGAYGTRLLFAPAELHKIRDGLIRLYSTLTALCI